MPPLARCNSDATFARLVKVLTPDLSILKVPDAKVSARAVTFTVPPSALGRKEL